MRVVLDSNCVISALAFTRGRLVWLRHAWQSGDIVPVADSYLVTEVARVLGYPRMKLSVTERRELLDDFVSYAEVYSGVAPVGPLPPIRDPADLPILALALAARAEALVTGDQDLLMLAGSVAISIITPAELALRLGRPAAPTPSAS